eukprot:Pgem_evm1s4960
MGLDIEHLFSNEEVENYRCSLCLLILDNTVEVQCCGGTLYCLECIEQVFIRNGLFCLLCRQRIEKSPPFVSNSSCYKLDIKIESFIINNKDKKYDKKRVIVSHFDKDDKNDKDCKDDKDDKDEKDDNIVDRNDNVNNNNN